MFFEEKKEIRKKENILLLVDFNNQLWRSWYAYSNLSFGGHSTACLFGIVTILAKYLSIFNPSYVVFADDSPPYLRREFFTDFKDNRSKLDPTMYNEFNKSRTDCADFLNVLNIPMVSEPGWEADDVIASLTRDYSGQLDKIVVLSNDDDLFQLLTYPNVVIQRSKVLYDLNAFNNEYAPLDIKDWVKLTALTGSHNNIPGLPGIGPVRAKKILTTGKWEEVYLQNKETLDLYLKLIKIPFMDDFKSPPLTKSSFNERQLLKFLVRFGIKLTQNMSDAFDGLN